MKTIVVAGLAASIGLSLSACQTPQARQAQLATICADPANRMPNTFYWSECQSLYPSSDRQLQKNYALGAATGQ
jgi:hypothetical protein